MKPRTLKFLFEACKRALYEMHGAQIAGDDIDLAAVNATQQLQAEFEEIAKLTAGKISFPLCDRFMLAIGIRAGFAQAMRCRDRGAKADEAWQSFAGIVGPLLGDSELN